MTPVNVLQKLLQSTQKLFFSLPLAFFTVSCYNIAMLLRLPTPELAGSVDPTGFAELSEAHFNRPRLAAGAEKAEYLHGLFEPGRQLLRPVTEALNARKGASYLVLHSFEICHIEPTLPGKHFGGNYVGEWHIDPDLPNDTVEVFISDIAGTDTLSGSLDTDQYDCFAGLQLDSSRPTQEFAQVLAKQSDEQLVNDFDLTLTDTIPAFAGLIVADRLVHRSPQNNADVAVARTRLTAKYVPPEY
jgi:hypothetical protein